MNGYISRKIQTSKLEKKCDGKFLNYSTCGLQEPPYALWILLPPIGGDKRGGASLKSAKMWCSSPLWAIQRKIKALTLVV
jgi:hypothetical protein